MSLLIVYFIYLLNVFPTLIHSKQIVHDEYSNNSTKTAEYCIEVERQILLSIKQGVEDPTGMLSSWHGRDCCKWSRVGCSNQTGHITKLDLRGTCDVEPPIQSLGLEGKLNPSLFELKHLHYLDLSCNNFMGTIIPTSIGSMKRLRYLNLSSTLFSGMFPYHLGNLSNLLYLDLNNDGYYGLNSAVDLNWLSGLPSLKFLNLGFVNLSSASTSWLHAASKLSSIEELHFPNCYLHHLPQSSLVSNFTSLSVLNLEGNAFNTTLPGWVLNITSLSHLMLGYAGIKNVPLKHLCNLKSLDLSLNDIDGEVTGHIDSLSMCNNVSMEELELSGNKLHGQLPESLGQLKNLRYLSLFNNMISGPIPASIGNLSHLSMFYVTNNKMNGTLPETIGQLEGLVQLHLGQNDWAGVINESHFLHLKNLKEFTLSSKNKSLTFVVSPNWVPSFSLTVIGIKDCRMDPEFPLWLKTQTRLRRVFLDNVGISGEIPSWFWKLISPQLSHLTLSNNQLSGKLPKVLNFTPDAFVVDLSRNLFEGTLPIFPQVRVLNLRGNSFSGPIPATIGSQMPGLQELELSENFLSGSIPASLGKLIDLSILSLSGNHLDGSVPDLKGLQSLYTLDLSDNLLVGKISKSLCSLPQLQNLLLGNNHLSGNIAFLRNCTTLSELRLEYNHFIGNIPRWIGEMMPDLSILSLRGNSLTGIISEDLCQLPYLHILDLGHNNLSGTIPSCVGNLTALSASPRNDDSGRDWYAFEQMDLSVKGETRTYITDQVDLMNTIDLSRNNLKGEIPDGLTNLSRLGNLNLAHNQLSGNLPDKIGRLTLLETLDLSSNHFSGLIPPSMTNMTSLSHLNLSYNNLSGPIPSANQFLTLNDPSIYEGNLYLCGSPLTTNCSILINEDYKDRDDDGDDDDYDENSLDGLWLYFFVGLATGFVAGFWAICGPLAINKSWRQRFYGFLDNGTYELYISQDCVVFSSVPQEVVE